MKIKESEKREALRFLNLYETGRIISERYEKRVSQGYLSRELGIKKSLYDERMEMIRDAIEEVPSEKYRAILRMMVVEGRSFLEIGQFFGITEASASRSYYRATKYIKVPKGVF